MKFTWNGVTVRELEAESSGKTLRVLMVLFISCLTEVLSVNSGTVQDFETVNVLSEIFPEIQKMVSWDVSNCTITETLLA